ncbi:MAG: hypothetical protein IJ415_04800 [Clostridia bacterium]|nr:hypothetical protein [Clostridia bacterium]
MKKVTKFVLIAVGVCLIIFGAFIPTIFSDNNSSVDKFTYNRNSSLSNYSVTVNVISDKEFEISSATITLQDAFDEYNKLEKLATSSQITKKRDGDEFVYTIVISLTQDEYFDFSKVSSVAMQTSIGQRSATEKTLLSSSINWRIPVMIVVIFIGVAIGMTGIAMLISTKAQKSSAEKARKEMAKTNPEINTTNMTDEEVLSKYHKINSENKSSSLAELFGIETAPKEKICDYCGSTNDADAKKCIACGASLRKKK